MPARLVVEPVERITPEILEAFERLLPQLSESALPNPDLLRGVVGHEATVLFIARIDDAIVGTTTLVIYQIPTGWRAHVDDVVVDASARGQGVGEALLTAALATATARGAKTVDLTSRPSRQPAIRLYQRMGFTVRHTQVYRHQVDPSTSHRPPRSQLREWVADFLGRRLVAELCSGVADRDHVRDAAGVAQLM